MGADALALLIPLVAVPVGCGTIVALAALLFPSTREALAGWLTRRHKGVDAEAVTAQLASANAQLAALRGEVYALRCEVAAVSQGLPSGARPPALMRGNE